MQTPEQTGAAQLSLEAAKEKAGKLYAEAAGVMERRLLAAAESSQDHVRAMRDAVTAELAAFYCDFAILKDRLQSVTAERDRLANERAEVEAGLRDELSEAELALERANWRIAKFTACLIVCGILVGLALVGTGVYQLLR